MDLYGFFPSKVQIGCAALWQALSSFLLSVSKFTKILTISNSNVSKYVAPYLDDFDFWHLYFQFQIKVRFLYQCSDHLSHSKSFTSLFPLIFLSKHISSYALGRIRWILDIIWPLNQHFKLKNQRNWLKQVWLIASLCTEQRNLL